MDLHGAIKLVERDANNLCCVTQNSCGSCAVCLLAKAHDIVLAAAKPSVLPCHVEIAILALSELDPEQFGLERSDYDDAVSKFDALLDSLTVDAEAR